MKTYQEDQSVHEVSPHLEALFGSLARKPSLVASFESLTPEPYFGLLYGTDYELRGRLNRRDVSESAIRRFLLHNL